MPYLTEKIKPKQDGRHLITEKSTEYNRGKPCACNTHRRTALLFFIIILENWNLVYSSCSEKDLDRWENNRNRRKKTTTTTLPSGKALGTAFA